MKRLENLLVITLCFLLPLALCILGIYFDNTEANDDTDTTETAYATWECPVCKDKGLKSKIFQGLGHATMTTNHYDSSTDWSCSWGHAWKIVWDGINVDIEITKDTEDESFILLEWFEQLTLDEKSEMHNLWKYKSVKFDGYELCYAKKEGGYPSVITLDYLFKDKDLMDKLTIEMNKLEDITLQAENEDMTSLTKTDIPYIEPEWIERDSILQIQNSNLLGFYKSTDDFKPTNFIGIINTDLSECFQDNRLRLNLNGEIYWIKLEKDRYLPYMPTF